MDNFSDREREALVKHPDDGREFHPVPARIVDHEFDAIVRPPRIAIRSIGRGGWRATCECGWDTNYLSDEAAATQRAMQHSSATMLDPLGGHLLPHGVV